MGGRPHIQAVSHLDVGFSCFSVFCTASTISSLWIPLPEEERSAEPESARDIGAHIVLGVIFTAAVFSALMWKGMCMPCMGLRVHPEWIMAKDMPRFRAVFEEFDVVGTVNADVNMWECIHALVLWSRTGDLNCVVALVMLAVFAIGFTVLDMLCLCVATLAVAFGRREGLAQSAIAAAHVLHHISMLGPAVVGVAVIRMGGASYKNQGVEFLLEPGLALLFGAELLHYALFWFVDFFVGAPPASALRNLLVCRGPSDC